MRYFYFVYPVCCGNHGTIIKLLLNVCLFLTFKIRISCTYTSLVLRSDQMEGQKKKYNVQSDIKRLIGKYCEVEKMMWCYR